MPPSAHTGIKNEGHAQLPCLRSTRIPRPSTICAHPMTTASITVTGYLTPGDIHIRATIREPAPMRHPRGATSGRTGDRHRLLMILLATLAAVYRAYNRLPVPLAVALQVDVAAPRLAPGVSRNS